MILDQHGKPIEKARRGRRRFKAGRVDRLTENWPTAPQQIDLDLSRDGRKLIARARDLAINNDYLRRWQVVKRNNVIGAAGIRLRSNVLDRGSGKKDIAASTAIEGAWEEWGKRYCDITRRRSFKQLAWLFFLGVRRDGESIFRHRLERTVDNPYGYSLQTIEPYLLDHQLSQPTAAGNEIVMGVELNRDRRPVRFYFLADRQNPFAAQLSTGLGDRHQAIEASEIIHSYDDEFMSQTRGFSCFVSTMETAHHMAGFNHAVVVGTRLAAATTGILETQEGFAQYEGDGDPDDDDEPQFEASPGSMHRLPAGTKLSTFKAEYPNATQEGFEKINVRRMAGPLGLSYFVMGNDLAEVNFATGRLGLMEDRESHRTDQNFVIENLCDQVFPYWLRIQLDLQTIRINGRPLRQTDADRYLNHSWRPRRWDWVDPRNEQQAAESKVRNRQRSISGLIRDAGEDPEEVWQELAEDVRRLEALGIPIPKMPGPGRRQTAGGQDPTDDDDDDDGTEDDDNAPGGDGD